MSRFAALADKVFANGAHACVITRVVVYLHSTCLSYPLLKFERVNYCACNMNIYVYIFRLVSAFRDEKSPSDVHASKVVRMQGYDYTLPNYLHLGHPGFLWYLADASLLCQRSHNTMHVSADRLID